MSKGHPDYFGIPYFPKYGTAKEAAEAGLVIVNGANSDAFEISSRSRILGGWVFIDGVVLMTHVGLSVTIDGVLLGVLNPNILLAYNYTRPTQLPVYLTNYDRGAKRINLAFTTDIPFESSFKINIANGTGADITVSGECYYHEIIG